MDWYIVTDSDGNWDSIEEGDEPAIFLADGPEDAIQQALDRWRDAPDGYGFDGIQVKVAVLKTIGFQIVDIQDGVAIKEAYLAVAEDWRS